MPILTFLLDKNGSRIGNTTQFGNFEYKRLPFGLASAPAVFKRFMQFVLKDIQYDSELHYVGCYLDDIIIASVGKDSHLELVDKILTILDKCGLTLTAKKVKLAEDSIEFLGYLIKDGKRFPTDEKVSTIKNWKLPTKMKDWYKFIGLLIF